MNSHCQKQTYLLLASTINGHCQKQTNIKIIALSINSISTTLIMALIVISEGKQQEIPGTYLKIIIILVIISGNRS